MRILIAEDEKSLAKGLKYLLEKNNFSVDTVYNGADALDYYHMSEYDVIVLDIMMPEMNGLEVLSQIRAEKSHTPIMMLSARSEVEDRVKGLEMGADDYLPKPFSTAEFIARVRALTRRNAAYTGAVISYGNIRLDCSRYELCGSTRSLHLNNKEYQLTELFFKNPKMVFSTTHLMDKIWGQDSSADIDVVWTYIGFIRKKLKELEADIEIRTIRGIGYALEKKSC